MMKEFKLEKSKIILAIWCLIIIVLVILSLFFKSNEKVDDVTYQKMMEASNLTQKAFDAIKQYKIESGIGISDEDIFNTGMIGTSEKTRITTTEGVLEAKRTTCNPEWAAVIIQSFQKAGLKEGDELGAIFSGSFPALNICVMCAAQVYGLKTCYMGSIGASYYGANQMDCTFLDMDLILYEKGILNKKLDYVSLGGSEDVAYEFRKEKENIINKIKSTDVEFIYLVDYRDNINYRLNCLKEKVPNMKLFINCGGTMVAYGKGINVFSETGYFQGNKRAWTLNEVINRKYDNYGLLQCVKLLGVDIFSMKDIKTLSEIYGIDYDPAKMPTIGTSGVFYKTQYNFVYAIIGLVLSIGFGTYYFVMFKMKKKNRLHLL